MSRNTICDYKEKCWHLMPRLSQTEWLALRADYEMYPDMSLGKLGEKHNITKAAIHRKAKTEGWNRDLTSRALALAVAKSKQTVNKTINELSPKKRDAVENYADEIYKLLQRQKKVWLRVWAMLHQAVTFHPDGTVDKKDFHLLKCTKITSEIITIAQKGERAAWGIDLDSPKIQVNTQIKNQSTTKLQSRIDWDSIPDAEKIELENLLKSINEKEE